MLNRRHLRIKILHALYAFEQSKQKTIAQAEKELFHNLERMYEMYIYLLTVMVEIKEVAARRIEDNKNKRLPSPEDLNPNTRFVDNGLIDLLERNHPLNEAAKKHKVNWMGEGELLRKWFKQLAQTEEYQTYMKAEETDFKKDQEVILRLFKRHLINYPDLHEFFEEKSIFWADDLDLVASMSLKTMKTFTNSSDENHPILPLWKEPEDEIPFVKSLFRKAVMQSEEHGELLREHSDNWELDRIALMDTLLMKMALSEAREFPQIPTKVTLNEYIELSKYYSTPKSSNFINGVLDKLFALLKEEGKIKKLGRGLIT